MALALLTDGLALSSNRKTGWSFNITAGPPSFNGGPCHGATEVCFKNCYGRRGRFAENMNGARIAARNWEILQQDPTAVARLSIPERARFVRLFGVGDLANRAMARAVVRLCRSHLTVQFWLYSRCLEEAGEILRVDPPNLVMWVSVDEDNYEQAVPFARDRGLPMAFMANDDTTIPGAKAAFVCPAIVDKKRFPLSRRANESPCVRCRFCFSPKVARQQLAVGVRFPIH